MYSSDILYLVALSKVNWIGPVLARKLLAHFGTAEAIFSATKRDLMQMHGISKALVQNLDFSSCVESAQVELRMSEELDYRIIVYTDKDYPYRLKQRKDSPIVLYYTGNGDMDHHRILAIVGTRTPTSQGISLCNQILESLQSCNIHVVSGLALGVDIAAHRKCLELDIPTYGVMGTGMDQIYPYENRESANKMRKLGGILTEFGIGTQAEKVNFPMRNRIIAGMCDGLLVVESKVKGGSMITAELANGYDRDVFALPGRPGDIFAQGCLHLIKHNKASLVENGTDIAHAMNWNEEQIKRGAQTSLFVELNASEQQLANLCKKPLPVSVDLFYQNWAGTPSELAATILGMELKGLLRQLPGKQYIWNG
ncbi:MAG: DNA-processing protein DprA [Saprospiraceae bacterium]